MKNLIFATVLFMLLGTALVYAAPLSYTVITLPVNATNYTTWPNFNVTLNNTGSSCSALYNNGTLASFAMENPAGNIWTNTTAINFGSQSMKYSNVTFNCSDGSTVYWSNTSNISGFYYFAFDGTNPTIASDNATMLADGTVNVSYNATDLNNMAACFVKILIPGSSSRSTYSATNASAFNKTWQFCNYTITSTTVGGTGWWYLQKFGTDFYGRNSTTSTNYANNTGVTYPLSSVWWNPIGTFKNETLDATCTRLGYATYTSFYNNTNHTFITHPCGTTTRNITVPDGTALYVAVNTSTQGYNVNYSAFTAPNVTIYGNQTATDTGWNMAGVYAIAGRTLSSICDFNTNITYVSYHQASNNTYFTHKCGWNINNVTAPAGSAVWILLGNSTDTGNSTSINP